MKTSLFSTSLTALDLQEAIRVTAEAGYDAMEIMCAPPHLTRELAQSRSDEVCSWLRAEGLGVSALSLSVEYTGDDESEWRDNVEQTCFFIRLCEKFETRTVKTMPGRPGSAQATRRHWEQYRRAMEIIVPVARSAGVRLAVETHLNHLSDSIQTAAQCIACGVPDVPCTSPVQGVLGVNLDFCNVRTCHEDPVHALGLFRGRIFLTHVKDSLFSMASGEYVPMGTGKMDYRPIIEGLRLAGYDGYLSVECLYRRAKQEDPRGAVADDLAALHRLMED